MIAYVKARHEELLGCVFALIKDWCKRGCPKTVVIDHTFPEFYQVMDWFCQDAALVSILTGQAKEQSRVASPMQQWLRKLGLQANKKHDEWWKPSDLGKLVGSDGLAFPHNVGNQTIQAFIGQQIEMEMRNARSDSILLDGIRIEKRISKDAHWRERALYRFKREQ